MIQRIQTFYLVLGAGILSALLFLQDNWQLDDPRVASWFNPTALGLTILAVVVALASVMLYKDRKRQFKTVLYVQLLTLALIGLFGVAYYITGDIAPILRGSGTSKQLVAIMLPFVGYVCFSMARRGIDRDIKLIQSMDRLR